jgi:hypothetical protein
MIAAIYFDFGGPASFGEGLAQRLPAWELAGRIIAAALFYFESSAAT